MDQVLGQIKALQKKLVLVIGAGGKGGKRGPLQGSMEGLPASLYLNNSPS